MCCRLQLLQFLVFQWPRLPEGEVTQSQRADGHAPQTLYLVSQRGQHPADLPVLAFAQHDIKDRALLVTARNVGPLRPHPAFRQPDGAGRRQTSGRLFPGPDR
jgi:hypothetical protein